MARVALLCDFGSTFTKFTALDLEGAAVVGRAVRRTALHHLPETLEAGRRELLAQGIPDFSLQLGCSSAAGGLSLAVSGLMPELTVEAARRAALGAGARVTSVFSHELTLADLAELEAAPPDLFLLTGGTDGGNRDNLLYNADFLARHLTRRFPVLIAGNRSVAEAASQRLAAFSPVICPNVMPRLGVLEVEPVQARIRALFLQHIVQAKGLDGVQAVLDRPLLPTPSAVLLAARLLAEGSGAESGLGDLMVVDIGGATTDVDSIAEGGPREAGVIQRGLPEPFAKRTVEGDMGLRVSAGGIAAAAGTDALARRAGRSAEALEEGLQIRQQEPGFLAGDESEWRLDEALTWFALQIGLERHAGSLETVYTALGRTQLLEGKDLSGVATLLLTGGPLIHSRDACGLARQVLAAGASPLLPQEPDIRLDRDYVLSAAGLLSQVDASVALSLLKKEFSP